MARSQDKTTYAEPTIMWRLKNIRDGRHAYAVIVPHGLQATAGWFSQGLPQESRHFQTWTHAIGWLHKKRLTLEDHGWSLEEDD